MFGNLSAQIVVNEASSSGGMQDVLGADVDWLELRNLGSAPAELAGMWLSDDAQEWAKWAFPASTPALAPGERRLVLASGRGTVEAWELAVHEGQAFRYATEAPAAWREPGFDDADWAVGTGGFGVGDGDDATVLPSGSHAVYLRRTFEVDEPDDVALALLAVDADDGFIAYLNGREIGRSENMQWATPGLAVPVPAWATEAQLYQGEAPEVVALDLGRWLRAGENAFALEVHGVLGGSVDLTARPFLALGLVEGQTTTPLPPWLLPPAEPMHTNFKLQAGETVVLTSPSGLPIDALPLPDGLRLGLSTGRAAANPSATCVFDEPTPGAANGSTCFSGIAPAPALEPASGWYGSAVTVSGDGVRFTLDGSDPTANSPVLQGSIPIANTAVVHARAFEEGLAPSDVVTRSYFIGEDEPDLPVVSITTHPDHLWDWETGIYVLGPNAQSDYPFLGANFWQPWSRFSRYAWFDEEGSLVDAGELDLEIHGGWSRGEPQKSFRLDFKNRYSGDLQVPVFAGRPGLAAFGNLNLRNGGQTSWTNKLKDGFLSTLALQDLRAPAGAWQPVELWLNGEYWGAYGAREKTDERWIADAYGIPEEHVDLLNQWEPLEGPPSAFDVSIAPLLELEGEAFAARFGQTFDLPAYIDYFALQIHGQNIDWISADWGTKNMKYFRNGREGGPWRYILFDLDATFGEWGTPPSFNALNAALNPPYPTVHSDVFEAFLDHPELRCQFVTRYTDLLNSTFEPGAFEARLWEAAEALAPAMPRHVDRWDSPVSVEYWQQQVGQIAQHNAARIAPSRAHLGTTLNLGSAHTVTTTWAPTGGGTVTVNDLPGAIPSWTGDYYGACPIELAAWPADGFGFTGWDANAHGTDLDLSAPFLSVELTTSDLFRANFAPCLGNAELVISTLPDGSFLATATGLPAPGLIRWWQNGTAIAEGTACTTADPDLPLHATLTIGDCTLVVSADGETGPMEVAELEEERGRIVPNPATATATLSPPPGADRATVTAMGRVIDEVRADAILNVSDWPAGVYVVVWYKGIEFLSSERLMVLH